MLETAKERVMLLKAGISAKHIEELYIESNDIKLVKERYYILKIG